ncbi:hypothetical protein AB6C66_23060 [Vibrio splendidus]|uniref:hypothetical protein n=2 Tax=Vibrio TaxID=662 RepID=UPI000379D0C3|nr:hypothetical protein [Vibrio splendidus]OEE16448.1 hypothetical protein OC1_10355 [Vibrio cyclitrophicus ZF207]OEF75110.1 hypothetical protein A148_17085 [Vibrio splendidus 1F-157]PTP58689.1 hypothetical protein CWO23_23805 [Vibrio splendidus]
MFWAILIFLAIFVMFFLKAKKKHDSKDPFNLNKFSSNKFFDEANEIALKIKTLRQLESLDDKIEKAQEQANNAITEKRQQQLDDKAETLLLAQELAYIYMSYWQYQLDLELDVQIQELELMNKKITNEEKLELEVNTQIRTEGWLLIRPDDEFETFDDDEKKNHKQLMKVINIFESQESDEIKIKKINTLINKEKSIFEQWFDFNDDQSLYEQLVENRK